MSDQTDSFYCSVGTLHWNVKINGTVVATYSWPGGTSFGGTSWEIKGTVAFPAVSPASGNFDLRIEATDTVCAGGGSWNWQPGGTITVN